MTPAQLSPVTREGPQQLGCGCPKPLALSTRATQWSKGRSRQTHVGTVHPEKEGCGHLLRELAADPWAQTLRGGGSPPLLPRGLSPTCRPEPPSPPTLGPAPEQPGQRSPPSPPATNQSCAAIASPLPTNRRGLILTN